MKLSESRPCDGCGGAIAPHFYVVRMSIALFNPQTTNEVLGLNRYFGGHLDLAEVMAPRSDVITIAMDDKEHKELMIELFLCQSCYLKPLVLALLGEKRAKEIEKAKKKVEKLGG